MTLLATHRLAAALAACLLVPAAGHANVPSAPTPGLAEVQDLASQGRGAEALRRIDTLIARHPQDPHLRFQKGVLLVDQKRTAEAIALFERMSREYPTLPEPFNNLAVLYAEQGQIEKARAALESAVRSRPSYDTAYQNLSSVNVRMASRAYARALQIDDSGTAPKLSLLKTLNGSQQDAASTAAAAASVIAAAPPPAPVAPPPAAPSPASIPAPSPAPAPAPTPAPPAPPPASSSATRPAAPASAEPRNENPATANSAQRRAVEEAREVQAAVRAWASAWERKDMNGYIGAYVPGYRAGDANASAWQAGRRMRIMNKTRISVELSGVTVELQPNNVAQVSFRQDYAADQLKASGRKTLELVRRDGRWLIRKESID